MFCDSCNLKEALFHSIRSINGNMKERHLCADCQTKTFPLDAPMGSLYDIFSNFSDVSVNTEYPKRREVKSCPNCLESMEQIIKSGNLGCPNCYDAFSETLIPMIQKVQNASAHFGKTPLGKMINSTANTDVNAEILTLRSALAKAVKLEDFEQATIIKSRLQGLEKRQKSE